MSLMPPSLEPPADVIDLGTLAATMQMRLDGVAVDPESQLRCVMSMPVAGNTQPFGLLHGGASAALAEQAGSVAAFLDYPGRRPVGVDLSIKHLSGAREGRVAGYVSLLSASSRLATYRIEIRAVEQDRADGGALIALAQLSVVFTA
ncbi:PaaI family thioesterase [Bowdeniella massiliensis]|uniref:PaaI family thioesterase n=1 Tax=Bowdeniella massiliensis TaxID=2932264 RepID=UPI0020286F0B|nr:PaaI family thioesterase [Bowdeniella massiliensis]